MKNVVFYRFSALYEGCLVQISRFLEFFGRQIAFIPPRLSKSSDEGFFKKLIDGKLEFLTQFTGGLADVPFVYIDGCHTSHFGESYWIEGTRNRLLPMETTTAISGINGTKGTSSFILDKDAVLATNNLSNKFTILVGIDNPFFLNLLLGIGSEVVMDYLISFFEKTHFFHGDGSTSIAFNATGTVAFLQVAAEEDFEEIEGNECVENFEHENGVLIRRIEE